MGGGRGGRGSNAWTIFHCSSQTISRSWDWSEAVATWISTRMGCQSHRQWIPPCHIVSCHILLFPFVLMSVSSCPQESLAISLFAWRLPLIFLCWKSDKIFSFVCLKVVFILPSFSKHSFYCTQSAFYPDFDQLVGLFIALGEEDKAVVYYCHLCWQASCSCYSLENSGHLLCAILCPK